jgi:hypothetical protein
VTPKDTEKAKHHMALGRLWAGNVYGTNTGNLFVRLEGDDKALKGTLRQHDRDYGVVVVYDIIAIFDGARLEIEGKPQQKEGVALGLLKATATLQPNGTLAGEWETDIGSAGTFVLHPHDQSQTPNPAAPGPDQVHSARHNFGPIEIDRKQLIALADDIQRSFTKGRVVVSFVDGTEQRRFLEDFRQLNFNDNRAEVGRLFVSEPDAGGSDKSITVEFGPMVNWVTTQSVSEAWVLGEREKLKREIKKFERVYASQAYGITFNQAMLLGTLVYLPSLGSLQDRVVLMIGVICLVYAVNWLHKRYLPHAAIYLGERKQGWFVRLLPSVASWVIGIAATVIATLLGAYLQGLLKLPTP